MVEEILSIIPIEAKNVVLKFEGNQKPVTIDDTNTIAITMISSNGINAILEAKLYNYSNIQYLFIYNILEHKQKYVGNKSQYEKIKIIQYILSNLEQYTELNENNYKYIIGIVIIDTSRQVLLDIMKDLPYDGTIVSFGENKPKPPPQQQIINSNNIKNKIIPKQRLFKAIKNTTADIYSLYDVTNDEFIGVAYVNDFATSNMLRCAFKNIKPKTLTTIEDSDDEGENIISHINVWCVYNQEKNAWSPVNLQL